MALGILATMTAKDDGLVKGLVRSTLHTSLSLSPHLPSLFPTTLQVPIEYNQIEGALGDEGGAEGYSTFPGNTNGISIRLTTYLKTLDATEGLITEFINPKFAEEEVGKAEEEGTSGKTKRSRAFKAPTRLECLMQDIAWCLPDNAKAGFTQLSVGQLQHSSSSSTLIPHTAHHSLPLRPPHQSTVTIPARTISSQRRVLSAKGVPPYGAATAEMAVYNAMRCANSNTSNAAAAHTQQLSKLSHSNLPSSLPHTHTGDAARAGC